MDKRPRAVFSINDMAIIKKALEFFLKNSNELTEEEHKIIAALYHRIGRIDE